MTRRSIVGLLAGAALLALPVQALAQDSVPPAWTLTLTTPSDTTSSSTALTADITRTIDPNLYRLVVSTSLTAPADLPAGCTAVVEPTEVTGSSPRFKSSAKATTTCNGQYTYTVRAQRRGRFTNELYDEARRTGTLRVVVPPAPVATVTASEGDGRNVDVSWVHTPTEPDFLGFAVERRAAGGDFEVVSVLDADASSWTDADPPAQGGDVDYRVLSRRAGAAPGEEVAASEGPTATATVAPAPSGEADPDDGDDDDPAGDGGGSGSSTTSRPSRSGSRVRLPAGSSRSGRVAPPVTGPPTTLDTGYDELLPFGDREPGGDEAVLPTGDETASMIYEDVPGRGLAVPTATGLVLAVWAFHLRYLARAARPLP